jgi:hypothetical protein
MKGFKKFLVLALVSAVALAVTVDAQAINSPFHSVNYWLTPATRTTTQNLADQTGIYAQGIRVVCAVSAASGTGGLIVKLQGKEPQSGTYYDVAATLNNTATGVITLLAGEGIWNQAATPTFVAANYYMPYVWRVQVVHGDASNYTYDCTYTLRAAQ